MIVVPCGEHACSMVVKPSSCKAIHLGSGSGSHRKKAPCHVFPKKYGLRPGLWQWCPCTGRNRLSGAFSWPFKQCLRDVSPLGANKSSCSGAHIFEHDWKCHWPHILKSSTSYLDYYCWCILSPCRGPSRGPCIGTIYPTLLGFGEIHLIIPSNNYIRTTFRVTIIWNCQLALYPCVTEFLR
jgi:hypothetical protein